MKVHKSFEEIRKDPRTVLTIGTFDGVHKGHRIVLDRLTEVSRREGCRAIALTFHPHPQTVLQTNDRKPIYLLTTIQERLKLFERFGVEEVLIIPFSYEFSRTSPEDFVRQYLCEKVGMSRILIGYDHFFGKDRQGNSDLLDNLGRELDFKVERLSQYSENDNSVSSTKIRHELLEGSLEKANSMLGYEYFLEGKVVSGDHRGAKLGFPTANIQSSHPNKLLPGNGVYFVSMQINGDLYFGMANIGTRPTFTDDSFRTLEVHLLNFTGNIYNKTVTVNFLKFLRGEQKFPNLEVFLNQLEADRDKCNEFIELIYKNNFSG